MPAPELTPEEWADAWEWYCTIHREAGRRYYVIYDDSGQQIGPPTLDRDEARASVASLYVLWRDSEPSHSVRTVSGGAFETNRRRH